VALTRPVAPAKEPSASDREQPSPHPWFAYLSQHMKDVNTAATFP
jgi:hypothetical protein